MTGRLPFEDPNIKGLFKKIVSGVFYIPASFPDAARDLVVRMLQLDPAKRIRLHEIKEHKWIRHIEMLYLDPREIRHYYGDFLRIKAETLEKVKSMGFDFKEFPDENKRLAIEQRREFSFVIGYNIMFDDTVKKNVISKLGKLFTFTFFMLGLFLTLVF